MAEVAQGARRTRGNRSIIAELPQLGTGARESPPRGIPKWRSRGKKQLAGQSGGELAEREQRECGTCQVSDLKPCEAPSRESAKNTMIA